MEHDASAELSDSPAHRTHMEKIQRFFRISFSTKVLAPVIATMMAVVAMTAWTVNGLMTQQFDNEAGLSLRTGEWVLRKSQKTALNNLGLRFRNLVNEPRYRAAFLETDEPTIRHHIENLLSEQDDIDAVVFSSATGKTLARQRRNSEVSISSF